MARGLNQDFVNETLGLEPTAILELFALYYNYQQDSQAVLYFHGGTNGLAGKIYFDGQEYLPLPVEASDFEVLGDQRLPRPKIKIANAGMYVSSMLRKYDNLNGAKLVRRRTYAKFLDDVNFPNNQNPWGSANPNARLRDDKFFISRKTIENKLVVEFELVSSLELENVKLPSRTIASRYCSWVYRGFGCRYGSTSELIGDSKDRPVSDANDNLMVTGSFDNWALNSGIFPIQKTGTTIDNVLEPSGLWETGKSYGVGDYIFRLSDRVTSSQGLTANYYQQHPVYYVCKSGHLSTDNTRPELRGDLWIKDSCSKKLGGCLQRYNNEDWGTDLNGINTNKDLPYGGFPGTEKYSY
jgi:lambda family phage minor tail protein L